MNLKLGQLTKLIKSTNSVFINQHRLCHVSSVKANNKDENLKDVKNESIIKQNQLFNEQQINQKNAIGRLNKIEVNVVDCKPHADTKMLMNQHLSTPAQCAAHLSELYYERSVIAKVDGQIWDMFRPLEKDCTLTFHHFNEEDNHEVNKAFWRSCSFLLGKIISNAFKDNVPVHLHSWPKPNYKSGSFIYDVQLPTLDNWEPRETELLTLTKAFWNLTRRRLAFERVVVPVSLAKEIFKDNELKSKQLDLIEKRNAEANLTLYRVDKFIDFSVGPMIPHTAMIGKVNVTAVHQINASCGKLYRFQACALPTQLPMHFYAYNILLSRSKQLNLANVP